MFYGIALMLSSFMVGFLAFLSISRADDELFAGMIFIVAAILLIGASVILASESQARKILSELRALNARNTPDDDAPDGDTS